eukprot:PLAT11264.3.p2 GENE.PLAT11264.3~~PLAT11264.3.p2  ORF type:complete len:124 (+),score=48.17 PLAT11264.3:41-373(+)
MEEASPVTDARAAAEAAGAVPARSVGGARSAKPDPLPERAEAVPVKLASPAVEGGSAADLVELSAEAAAGGDAAAAAPPPPPAAFEKPRAGKEKPRPKPRAAIKQPRGGH